MCEVGELVSLIWESYKNVYLPNLEGEFQKLLETSYKPLVWKQTDSLRLFVALMQCNWRKPKHKRLARILKPDQPVLSGVKALYTVTWSPFATALLSCSDVILVANCMLMVAEGRVCWCLNNDHSWKKSQCAWKKKDPFFPLWQRSFTVVTSLKKEADAANWRKEQVFIKIIKQKRSIYTCRRVAVS